LAANEYGQSPFKAEVCLIIFNTLIRTAKKTQHFTITKINWLTLFKEITAVYSEYHTKQTNTK
jgi:phospholipase/lecithinase/hemolysin